MPESRKRPYESPTEEDNENEFALMEELERQARAVKLSEMGTKITEVPYQRPGYRRIKIQELDQFESRFDFSESEDGEIEVEEVCYVLNGGDPNSDLDKYITARPIKMIRKALELAYRELNEVLIETIDLLMVEAIGLGIGVDEDEFHALRNDVFHEDKENQFMSGLQELGMSQAVAVVMQGRCELAWVKDNRDRLVDYVEEAKAIREVNGTHELRFEFYQRATYTELLEDQQRDRVRAGRSDQDLLMGAEIKSGIESPTKRKKSGRNPYMARGASPLMDAEDVDDEVMQD